MDSKLTFVLS